MKCLYFLMLLVSAWVEAKDDGGVVYEGHQLWSVTPASDQMLNALRQVGDAFSLDFWKDPVSVGRKVDFRVPPKDINAVRRTLTAKGITDIKVVIGNIQSLITDQEVQRKRTVKSGKSRAARTLATFDYTIYHTAEEIYEWTDMVIAEYGSIVTKKQIGVTYEGRPMYVLEVKKPTTDGSVKPVIYVDSLVHCREWITTASLMFIFKEMLTNPDFSDMTDKVDWYFIPMINVDGYVDTWTRERLWRKTKSIGASSVCHGVDANRNWDAFWSGPGASGNPCSLTYYGPTAASESEIRHLQKYITKNKDDIKALLNIHSYGQLILYSYKYDNVLTPEDALLNSTAKKMSDAIYSKHGKRYDWGPGPSTLYVLSGSTTDWGYEKAGIVFSYSYELRDNGEYGFLLPEDQIIPNAEEFILGLRALADHLDEFGAPERQ